MERIAHWRIITVNSVVLRAVRRGRQL